MSLDPLKPYVTLARTIAVAVAAMLLTGALFAGGCAVGKGQADKQIAKLTAKLQAKDTALADAARSLRAAADALRAVNAEAQRRLAAAAEAKRAANQAAIAAEAARHAAEARLADYDRREAEARKRPACQALLATNLQEVCGL